MVNIGQNVDPSNGGNACADFPASLKRWGNTDSRERLSHSLARSADGYRHGLPQGYNNPLCIHADILKNCKRERVHGCPNFLFKTPY